MEMTFLESMLEKKLLDLEMPLGERVYAEDLDFEAELEDLISDVKSTDHPIPQIIYGASFEQVYKGRQPLFLKRESEIYNGLGFRYHITACEFEVGEKNPGKKIVDKIISKRDFGKRGSENLDIYYDRDFLYDLEKIKSRSKKYFINKFYEDTRIFSLMISNNYKISIENDFNEINKGNLRLGEILEEIGHNFDQQYLTESNNVILMSYLEQVKKLV